MARVAVGFVALVALGGCGARTALEGDGGAGGAGAAGSRNAGGAGGTSGGCPRADGPTSIELAENPLTLGVVSSGCSFGATWVEPGGDTRATTFRVVDGAWQAAPVVSLGSATNSNGPAISWDGNAYVIAWADKVLNIRRMAEDGTFVGPALSSFPTPGNVYIDWLLPAVDGSLSVGLRSNSGGSGYEVYFARVAFDGEVLLAPTALTSTGNADVAGFIHEAGENSLLWTEPNEVGVALHSATFDDAGVVQNAPTSLLTSTNVLVSRHGAAQANGERYVGVLRVTDGPSEVLVARITPSGLDPLMGVAGADVPVLAATGGDVVGILARSNREAPVAPLELSIFEGGEVISTQVLGDATSSYSYAMAGSETALGALWASPNGLSFATLAP